MISFVVDGDPVPKQRPRFGHGRRAYTPQKTRDYQELVGWVARAAGAGPLTGPVSVTLRFFRAREGADIDNLAKACLDSLNGVLWRDDHQVVELHCYRDVDRDRPRCEVEIQELQD